MADDYDDLDHLLRPVPDGREPPTWQLALLAFVAIMATVMWITRELATWWSSEVYCGWFLC